MCTDAHTYIYTHTNIHIHKYIHIYAYNAQTKHIQKTKQNVHENMHANAYILNLYDLIPHNSQTHPIKFLVVFDNTVGSGL